MPSFDVVSELDHHEIDNAIDQAKRELVQRYDFKGTETTVERNPSELLIRSNAEGRLAAALQVIEEKMVRRKVSLKALDAKEPQPAGGTIWKQQVLLREGVDKDKARDIVKTIKESRLKVQASIQGDAVRINGKKRDDLQDAIAVLKDKDFGLPLQFNNFRD